MVFGTSRVWGSGTKPDQSVEVIAVAAAKLMSRSDEEDLNSSNSYNQEGEVDLSQLIYQSSREDEEDERDEPDDGQQPPHEAPRHIAQKARRHRPADTTRNRGARRFPG